MARKAKGAAFAAQECSSAGRASVSKTECRGFESLHSCQISATGQKICDQAVAGLWGRSLSRSGGFLRPTGVWRRACRFAVLCLFLNGLNNVAKTSPGDFVRQVRAEASKIVWPTNRETMVTAVMVVIMTTLLGVFFFGIDTLFGWIVRMLLGAASGQA